MWHCLRSYGKFMPIHSKLWLLQITQTYEVNSPTCTWKNILNLDINTVYNYSFNKNRAIPMSASMSKTNMCDSGSLGFVRRPWIMRGNAWLFCWSLPSWLVAWWNCCNWCNPRCNKINVYRYLYSLNMNFDYLLTVYQKQHCNRCILQNVDHHHVYHKKVLSLNFAVQYKIQCLLIHSMQHFMQSIKYT